MLARAASRSHKAEERKGTEVVCFGGDLLLLLSRPVLVLVSGICCVHARLRCVLGFCAYESHTVGVICVQFLHGE